MPSVSLPGWLPMRAEAPADSCATQQDAAPAMPVGDATQPRSSPQAEAPVPPGATLAAGHAPVGGEDFQKAMLREARIARQAHDGSLMSCCIAAPGATVQGLHATSGLAASGGASMSGSMPGPNSPDRRRQDLHEKVVTAFLAC